MTCGLANTTYSCHFMMEVKCKYEIVIIVVKFEKYMEVSFLRMNIYNFITEIDKHCTYHVCFFEIIRPAKSKLLLVAP